MAMQLVGIQIKTMIRCHYVPIRTVKMKNSDNTKYHKDVKN